MPSDVSSSPPTSLHHFDSGSATRVASPSVATPASAEQDALPDEAGSQPNPVDNTNVFADRLLGVADVVFVILAFSTARSLYCLARTCRAAHDIVCSYVSHAFSVEALLLRFFPDPLAFRSIQARTGTLISGSAALQFFDRDHYPEADLDLYVYMRARYEVGAFLLAAGYKFEPNSNQNPNFNIAVSDPKLLTRSGGYTMRGVASVLTFRKPSAAPGREDLKVQMIIAARAPMEVVLGFHSTCVMNVIAYDKAYSLYPRATFEDRCSLVCRPEGPQQDVALAKYEARGWKMHSLPFFLRHNHRHAFRLGPRSISDADSWAIPLDLAGVDWPERASPASAPVSQDSVAATSWHLDYNDVSGVPIMEYDVLQSEVLRYAYVMRDDEIGRIIVDMLMARCAAQEESDGPDRFYDEQVITICLAHLREQQLSGLRP